MNLTERLANFIVETDFDSIPSEGIRVVKRVFLDCIGVTFAGYSHPLGKIITEFIKDTGASPKATVLGAGFKTSPSEAALANGTIGHALDYDDYSLDMAAHPSVSLLPGILALGELRGVSGRKAMEAYVVGFECESKLGAGINPKHYYTGWHATGTLGTMGAAAACSKILGLDVERTRITLGIAASEAGGLRENFGTMTKPFHGGLSARNGVIASLLAEKGFTADKNILEAERGFCNIFCGKGEYDNEKIIGNLGDPFSVLRPGIGIKPYPSCGGTHTALDAMLYMVQEYDIRPEDIEKVHVDASELIPKALIHSRPKTGLEGKFSMQFCMAIAILERNVGMKHFTDEKARDPRVVELGKKVTLKPVSELKVDGTAISLPVNVTVKLKDGKEFSRRVDIPKGYPDIPMSRDELTEKFKDCTQGMLSAEKSRRVIEIIDELEHIGNINELMGLLI